MIHEEKSKVMPLFKAIVEYDTLWIVLEENGEVISSQWQGQHIHKDNPLPIREDGQKYKRASFSTSTPDPVTIYPYWVEGEVCTCNLKTYEIDGCPYQSDVHDNHEAHCGCCPYCAYQCAQDR